MILTSQQLPLHWNHPLTSEVDNMQAQYIVVYVDISTEKKKLNPKML